MRSVARGESSLLTNPTAGTTCAEKLPAVQQPTKLHKVPITPALPEGMWPETA